MAKTAELRNLKNLINKASLLSPEQKEKYLSALGSNSLNDEMVEELQEAFTKEANHLGEEAARWAREIEEQKQLVEDGKEEIAAIVEKHEEEAKKEVENLKRTLVEIEKKEEKNLQEKAGAKDKQGIDAIRKNLGLK